MTSTAIVTLDDSRSAISADLQARIVAAANWAWAQWAAALDTSLSPRIRIEIKPSVSNESGRAAANWAAASTLEVIRFDDGSRLVENAFGRQLRTGVDPNGDVDDFVIEIQASYIEQFLHFDPTPDTAGDLMADRVDGQSVLLHEIGHLLGMIGYGATRGAAFTAYDLSVNANGSRFLGANARAVYGAAVPLTSGDGVSDYTHYGNAQGAGSEPLLRRGLMNGVQTDNGVRYAVGAIDLAILADTGVGTRANDLFSFLYFDVLDGRGGIDTFAPNYGGHTDPVVIERTAGGFRASMGIGISTLMELRNVERIEALLGPGADRASGGDLADVIRAGDGADTLSGGGGDDSLFGEGGADAIDGNAGADFIFAGAGADVVDGGDGDDRVFGADDGDRLIGGAGADLLNGEGGDDVLRGDAGADLLSGEAGRDTLAGGEGGDVLLGGVGDDALAGEAGEDALYGQADADTLEGGDGADLVNGMTGDDRLFGGSGADVLSGELGADLIYGGRGADVLIGGGGADRFILLEVADSQFGDGGDLIIDFERGVDVVDFSAVDADLTRAGDQAFVFSAAFSGVAGQATLTYDSATDRTVFRGDVNGDFQADVVISFLSRISAADGFIL